jgi:hypothetical protein
MHYTNRQGKSSSALLGRDLAHWSAALQTEASLMDGNTLVDNGDGSFNITEAYKRYSDLDLYGMGLIPARDVKPLFLVDNPLDKNGNKIDVTSFFRPGQKMFGQREDISMAQIVSAIGPRNPSWDKSPHDFRIAWALLTRPGEHASDVADIAAQLDVARKVWEQKFYAYTGGRGTMCTQLSAPCGAPTAKVIAGRFDEAGGNGNGTIEPGERVRITFTLANDGDTPARDVMVTASSDLDVKFDSDTVNLPLIPIGATATATFDATLPADVGCGAQVLVRATATAAGNSFGGFATTTPGIANAYDAAFDDGAAYWATNLYGTDDASQNRWEWGVPLSYGGFSGFTFQPGVGHAGGAHVWMTGLERGHRGRQDSSVGVGDHGTTLWSPPIPLAGTLHPTLRYWVWYQAISFGNSSRGGQTRDDLPLDVAGSTDGGKTWVQLDQVTGANAAWQQRDIDLESPMLTAAGLDPHGMLRLRVNARNDDPSTMVEAGLDEVRVITQTPACAPNQVIDGTGTPMTIVAGAGCDLGRRTGRGFGALLLAIVALAIARRRQPR